MVLASERYQKIIKNLERMAAFIGVFIFPDNFKFGVMAYYTVVLLGTYYLITFYTYSVTSLDNWSQIMQQASITVLSAQAPSKLYVFLKHGREIFGGRKWIHDIIRKYEKDEIVFRSIVNTWAKRHQIIWWSIAGTYILTYLIVTSIPFFLYFVFGKMVLLVEYEFGVSSLELKFSLNIILQLFQMTSYTVAIFMADYVFIMEVIDTVMLVDIWKAKLQIFEQVIEHEGSNEEKISKMMRDLVQWHQAFSRFTKSINDCHSAQIATQIGTSVLAIAITIFNTIVADWPAGYPIAFSFGSVLFGYCAVGTISEAQHLSKSIEILNEAYDIVQLSLSQQNLLVSTTFRSILCSREKNGQWRVLQVGKKDRKVLSGFGGTFCCPTSTKTSTALCCRPGLRFWIADCNGNVQQTLLFKEAITKMPIWEIPLLNPSKGLAQPLQHFGKVFMFSKNCVITHDENRLFILNLEKLRVEATTQIMRGILDIAICDKEIFVLEGPRSLIRISSSPEPPNKTTKIIFNPLLPPPIPSRSIFENPFEFEAEEEAVINAEECFELPPIQHIDLDIPIEAKLESPTSQQNRLLMEQNRRIEVFDRINEMQFEDSILYRSGAHRRHKKDSCKGHTSKKRIKGGIVEIGQAMNETPSTSSSDTNVVEGCSQNDTGNLEVTTRPLQMDASFCTDNCLLPDLRSPGTLQKVLEPKERALAESLNLEPVKLVEISKEDLLKSASVQNESSPFPILQYPIRYPITGTVDNVEVQTTPRKKLHFIPDEPDSPTVEKDFKCNNDDATLNICRDMRNVMIQSDYATGSKSTEQSSGMTKSLQFVTKSPFSDYAATSGAKQTASHQAHIMTGEDVPDVQRIPEHMKIPSIWNVKIEKVDDSGEQSDTHISGDWEIVDN